MEVMRTCGRQSFVPEGILQFANLKLGLFETTWGTLHHPEVETMLNTLTSYQVTEYWFAIDVQVLLPAMVMFRPVMLHEEDIVALVPTGVVAGPGVNIVVGLPGGLVTL